MFYGHKSDCFSTTQTGIAEKLMFSEIAQRHDGIVYEQQSKIKSLEAQKAVMVENCKIVFKDYKRIHELVCEGYQYYDAESEKALEAINKIEILNTAKSE
jgi:hypothetical protein